MKQRVQWINMFIFGGLKLAVGGDSLDYVIMDKV